MLNLFSERIIRGDEPRTIAPGLLTIRDQRIDSVDWSITHIGQAREKTQGDVFDAGRHLVTPAFINGHSHLAMCAFRGLNVDAMDGNVVEEVYFRLEGMLTSGDVRAFARMGAYESILSGVASVWDHYYHAEALAEALMDVGMTGVIAPTLQDLDGPGIPQLDAQLQATQDLALNTRLHAAGIGVALGPHATDTVSDELWRRIADIADAHDLMIHTHAAQSVEEYERNMTLHGRSPIERLDQLGVLDAGRGTLLVHSLFVTQSDLKRLNPRRTLLGYCPYSQAQFCFPAEAESWWSAGHPIVVGTDCGACNDTMNVQQELRLLTSGRSYTVTGSQAGTAFRAQGEMNDALALDETRRALRRERSSFSDTQNVLSMVWENGGQLDGILNSGVIRAGARANLCLWDLSHPMCWPANDPFRTLVMSDMTHALWGMVSNGQWLGTPGNFKESILRSPAFFDAQNEAKRRLESLYNRLGLPLPN